MKFYKKSVIKLIFDFICSEKIEEDIKIDSIICGVSYLFGGNKKA